MNPYQAGIPAEIFEGEYPNDAAIHELRKSGFWASFLGWTVVVGMSIILCFVLLGPSVLTAPEALVTRMQETSTSPTVHAQSEIEASSDIPANESVLSDTRPSGTLAGDAVDPGIRSGVAVFGAGQIVLSTISILATLGMVVMLFLFGSSTKKLLRKRGYAELHRVAIMQRWLWRCVGIYCVCSMISIAMAILAMESLYSKFNLG